MSSEQAATAEINLSLKTVATNPSWNKPHSIGWAGWATTFCPGWRLPPGEPAAEHMDHKQVFLFDRLQTRLEVNLMAWRLDADV